jgi:small nuclear ribonucleoprotein E
MTLPINLIFRFLQNKTPVRIWLHDQPHYVIEGIIIGFDEYMNVVMDGAREVTVTAGKGGKGKKGEVKEVGRLLLKGECITLLQEAKK